MLDSRKQNPYCNFAEELVSYIYDEMNASEKADFETHLADCTPCVDEVAAFSSVSFSIKAWRDEEFATLETPQISIPYETEKTPIVVAQTDEVTESWLDKLLDSLNFSPAFFKTATAFGTVALAIGLAWFLMNSSGNENQTIVDNDKKDNKEEITTPVKSEKPEQATEPNLADNKVDETNDIEDSQPKPELAVATPKPERIQPKVNKRIVKVKSTPKRVNKNKSVNKPIPAKNKETLKKQEEIELKEIPRLTDFAIDDTVETDFRLTDFSEDDESGD